MTLTAEQLTAFLEARRRRIAPIVAPDDVDVALAEIGPRIEEQLPVVKDEKSLDSYVTVYAVDFALKKYYSKFQGTEADGEPFTQLLQWRGEYVDSEIAKTIRVHLFRLDGAPLVAVETKMALWEHRMSFDRRRPYIAWARGIAKNKARSHPCFDSRIVSIDTGTKDPLELPSKDVSVEESLARDQTPPAPAAAYAELLRMISEAEPHMAIAFLFHRYLRMKPADIAARIADLPLAAALGEVAKIVKEKHPDIKGIDTLLAPLAGRVAGREEKFCDYFQGEDPVTKQIGRWSESTRNSLGAMTVQKSKRFLRLVCDCAAAPHEIVCFLWLRFLYSPPAALRLQAGRPVLELVIVFEERYAQRELITLVQTQQCTRPLRQKASPDCTLDSYAGLDLYRATERWCAHVELLIAPAAEGEHLIGCAYVIGSLRRGKEKIRR